MKGQEWYQADDVAEEYDTKRFSRGGQLIDRREKDAVREGIGSIEGKRVLEIACGTGRFTTMLAGEGAEVVALDISEAMLLQGRAKARRAGVADRIEFLRGDAARLPFPDDHFDIVIAMRFFHLADDPESYLTEIARVSRDQLIFDTFKQYSLRSLYNWALPMGSRLYSTQDVTSVVATSPFRISSVDHDFILPYGLYRILPNVVANPVRRVDTRLGSFGPFERLSTVSFWDLKQQTD